MPEYNLYHKAQMSARCLLRSTRAPAQFQSLLRQSVSECGVRPMNPLQACALRPQRLASALVRCSVVLTTNLVCFVAGPGIIAIARTCPRWPSYRHGRMALACVWHIETGPPIWHAQASGESRHTATRMPHRAAPSVWRKQSYVRRRAVLR